MRIHDAIYLASATDMDQLPDPAFGEVAFAGRSNVGKSSLINRLVERKKLVRTSGTPGATRMINLFRITLRDPEAVFDLVDLPGYGYAHRSKSERKSWGTLIERFLIERSGLRAVVVICDARRGFEEDDMELIEFLLHYNRTPILVATKLDKMPANQRPIAMAKIKKQAGRRVYGVSGETGDGREELLNAILKAAHFGPEEGKLET